MKLLFPALLLCFMMACDDPEPQPAFIVVEGVENTSTGENADDLSITEVWLFTNGDFLGAYAIPARIPVLLTGTTAVEIRLGVRQDGRSIVPEIYPFYRTFNRTVDLQPGVETNLGTIPVSYTTETNFALSEDFEPGRPRVFTEVITGETGAVASSETVYQGTASGKITLTDDVRTVEIATAESFSDLTSFSVGNVWVEVNYLSDVPVIWGIVGIAPGAGFTRIYDPGFNPSSEWNKIYFNLTGVVGNSMLDSYNFALTAFMNDPEQTMGTVFLDNIKVLYL
ncbi:MAG: hypothetical protein AAF828_06195 [Bacteroidota bacterium]